MKLEKITTIEFTSISLNKLYLIGSVKYCFIQLFAAHVAVHWTLSPGATALFPPPPQINSVWIVG